MVRRSGRLNQHVAVLGHAMVNKLKAKAKAKLASVKAKRKRGSSDAVHTPSVSSDSVAAKRRVKVDQRVIDGLMDFDEAQRGESLGLARNE